MSYSILVHDTFPVKTHPVVAGLERQRQTPATTPWPSTRANPNRSARHPGASLDHEKGHRDNWIFVGSGLQCTSRIPSGCAFVMAAVLLPAAAQAVLFTQSALFDFENTPVRTSLPFADTVNGLTANFSGQAPVCNTGAFFATLMGNTTVQQFCNNPANGDQTGPLGISFSSDLSSVSFNFATLGGTVR
jgi:hypothetical protein